MCADLLKDIRDFVKNSTPTLTGNRLSFALLHLGLSKS